MNKNLKTVAKISYKTGLKWFFIVFAGIIITIITFSIALFDNADLAGSGHGSFISLFVDLLTTNFFAFFLVFGAPVFTFLYILLANKIALQNAISLIWKENVENYITTIVKNITLKITEKENWQHQVSSEILLKAKLLQTTKNSKDTSVFQKKIISYGLKKIRLDDIDFQYEYLNFADVISFKFSTFLSEKTEASIKPFWLLIISQISILILSFLV
ncbi:hypothetical protein [Tenacibaculum sp. MAR_2009_124]|uniref:hypothetical protein n=1 Tax=Tenacibaculum sp. MAR_2009_124 TaxID=1250059 RepID=UPI000B87206E|nr:hypothetical protein [Tenacibaculum sp. MAR_2009_124]